jgi:hypothetical protein
MLQCWEEDPEKRPAFETLMLSLLVRMLSCVANAAGPGRQAIRSAHQARLQRSPVAEGAGICVTP